MVQGVLVVTPSEFRAARKRLGLSVAKLAEALGVTDRTINRYNGGDWPIPETVALAMEALEARAAQK